MLENYPFWTGQVYMMKLFGIKYQYTGIMAIFMP